MRIRSALFLAALLGMTALHPVTMNFLDPFEIYYRDYADLEIRVLGSVHLVSDHSAMKALVEQELGLFRQVLPGRKRTWSLAKNF